MRIGATLHFLIALGHLVCLFFLEEAFKAYGILQLMRKLCFGQEWLLYVLTVGLSIGFAIAGLYALSASGDIRRLPLQQWAIIAIVAIYTVRVVAGAGCLLVNFSSLQLFSTIVPALLVYCYVSGLKPR